jgi:Asp-tRNA(Asn)/Glu-tRNA(Gln) amidotransferase C subunit
VAKTIKENPSYDLEELLDEDDRLFFTAASQGSVWLTFLAKTASAFKTLFQIAPIFFDEGRHGIIGRSRAITTLKRLEVEQKHHEIVFTKLRGIINIAKELEKIKDRFVREEMYQVFSANLTTLGHEPLLEASTEQNHRRSGTSFSSETKGLVAGSPQPVQVSRAHDGQGRGIAHRDRRMPKLLPGRYPLVDERLPLSELVMLEAPPDLEALLKSQAAVNGVDIIRDEPVEIRFQSKAYPDATFLVFWPRGIDRIYILVPNKFALGRA